MTIVRKCSCGKEFEITDNEQAFYKNEGLQLPKKCPECRKIKKENKKIICADCGEEFEMEGTEILWYYKKGYSLPKRCKKCRDKRNNKKGEMKND